MTKDQEEHLELNVEDTVRRMKQKYHAGQVEHGGDLWNKKGMLTNIENEVADLNNYIPTLRGQLKIVLNRLVTDQIPEAVQLLVDILDEPSD